MQKSLSVSILLKLKRTRRAYPPDFKWENPICGDSRSNSPAKFLPNKNLFSFCQIQTFQFFHQFSLFFSPSFSSFKITSSRRETPSLHPPDRKMEKDGFHALPPAKRFMHLQQSSPSSLPVKKRADPHKESAFTTTASYCLPAKKRVWAPPHLFSPLDASSECESKAHTPKKQPQPPPPLPELPDLNAVEAPDEDDPVLEKAEEATGGADEDGIVCGICSSTDGDPSDPIVFCDGCDLTVHATCYGDPLVRAVPDGDWFCHRCDLPKEGREKNVDSDCFLCPIKGGATKPAVDGRWAHIACSLLVPEVFFKDAEGREGIDCSRVPCRRWEGVCYICSTTNGCVIDCSEPKCSLVFHVGCGLEEDLCIEYREGRGGAVVAGFCKVHTQLWHKQQRTGKFKIVPREQKRKKM